MSEGENRIDIYGPKSDGSYWLELRQADGQSLVVSVPASEAAVRQQGRALQRGIGAAHAHQPTLGRLQRMCNFRKTITDASRRHMAWARRRRRRSR
jgi:hypothetical protein